jgi:hypothetical protein
MSSVATVQVNSKLKMNRKKDTNMKITVEISPEVSRRATERAAREGTTLTALVRQTLEEYATEVETENVSFHLKRRSFKINEFNRNWKPTATEVKESLTTIAEAQSLAEEIGRKWPVGVSAVDALREDRREL